MSTYYSTDIEDVMVRRSTAAQAYTRKTCKKAKAASLSIFDDSEDSSGVLCEGVGAETCYPPARIRRHTRGFCGDLGPIPQNTDKDIGPTQVGDTYVGDKSKADIEETSRNLDNGKVKLFNTNGKRGISLHSADIPLNAYWETAMPANKSIHNDKYTDWGEGRFNPYLLKYQTLMESRFEEGKHFLAVASTETRTDSDDDAPRPLGIWDRVRKRLRRGARWLLPPRRYN